MVCPGPLIYCCLICETILFVIVAEMAAKPYCLERRLHYHLDGTDGIEATVDIETYCCFAPAFWGNVYIAEESLCRCQSSVNKRKFS